MASPSVHSICRYSYIFISLLILFLTLAPFTIVFLKAEPGISALYRRALSMSDSKDSKNAHPMITLVDKSDDLEAQGLHSHDNHTDINSTSTMDEKPPTAANTTTLAAATKEENKTVSNIMMAAPVPTSDINLVDDIHRASAQIVKDWGFGWDSSVSRIAQVLLGLVIYGVVMLIKGFIIEWGLAQVEKQLSNAINGSTGDTDVLANLVNLAVNNLASKFGN